MPSQIVGRFAPSPTGPLHFGSLVAALGSFLEARAAGGTWLVRMEDLDQPRAVAGAAEEILRTLEAFALHWDDAIMYQSARSEAYASALDTLLDKGLAYGCTCSRRDVARAGRRGESGIIYPGTCRHGNNPTSTLCIRIKTFGEIVMFVDATQGPTKQSLDQDVGDFVIRRGDGIHAYQLAVVVDDAAQCVTQIVRGSDLLTSTPRQIYLQRALGCSTPTYRHLPLAVTAGGEKLSKMTSAAAVNRNRPGEEMVRALEFLGQKPSPDLSTASANDVVAWAVEHWNADVVPARLAIPVSSEGVPGVARAVDYIRQ